MAASVIVWDIETVPDLRGFAQANGHEGKSDDEIRVAMGDKFPKHIYHSIICIGALVAHQESDQWTVDALGAPHIDERSEKALISSFVQALEADAPSCVPDFEERLMRGGYLDTDHELYGFTRTALRDLHAFGVREGFPRLTGASVPSVIVDASYDIDQLTAFRLTQAELSESLRQMGGLHG